MRNIFDSLKQWINVPFQYRPFIKRSGAGTKQFGDAVDALCYPVGEVKLVTDRGGAEVVSSTQLYLFGTENISIKDNVIFEGEERPILRINSFYREGVVDIKVVYL